MKQNNTLSILAALCAVVLSSCVGGPTYESARASLTPKPGKGLVVAYWGHGFAGAIATFHLYANDKEVGHGMGRGSFMAFDAAPGPLALATRGKINAATAVSTAITALPTAGISLALAAVDNSVKIKSPDVNVVAGATHFMRWSPNGMIRNSRKCQGAGREGNRNMPLGKPRRKLIYQPWAR